MRTDQNPFKTHWSNRSITRFKIPNKTALKNHLRRRNEENERDEGYRLLSGAGAGEPPLVDVSGFESFYRIVKVDKSAKKNNLSPTPKSFFIFYTYL